MQSKATSSLSAVRIVERKAASDDAQMVLGLAHKPISAPARNDAASLRIRQARQLLEDLVLEDEFQTENGLLLAAVSESLSEILLELEQLVGLQRMFELWVQDAL